MGDSAPERPLGPRQLLLLATVAQRYYLQGRSKVEIADELGISRFKVARHLEEALARGIVRIEVVRPESIDPELSERLAERYGLRAAIVVDTPDTPGAAMREDLGRVCGSLLGEIVDDGDTVGVAWGRTLAAMAASVRSLPRCSVVQLTGALSSVEVAHNSIEVVRQLSRASGGQAYPVYAPLFLSDAQVADSLRRHPEVSDAAARYGDVDVAVIPIGSWDPPNSQLYDALDEQERRRLRELGVVADSCAVMFDGDGNEVRSGLSDRTIAVPSDVLRSIPEVVAVAGGADKATAMGAVLRAGFVTTLVTNRAAAEQLLSGEPPADTSPSEPAATSIGTAG